MWIFFISTGLKTASRKRCFSWLEGQNKQLVAEYGSSCAKNQVREKRYTKRPETVYLWQKVKIFLQALSYFS